MVNERAPPKVPLNTSNGNPQRAASPDVDDLFSQMESKGIGSPPPKAGVHDPFTGRPTFGHPTKMLSSLKQKANVFNPNRGRPEHHLNQANSSKVRGPEPPRYQDRKASPKMPMFSTHSSGVGSLPPPPARAPLGDEVFYTDPNKASDDLKNLLEGVMDEDEEDEPGQQQDNAQIPKDNASKNDTDPKSGYIEGLKVRLLPHQVEGVSWMRGRELGPVKRGKVPKGGILADDMGLGKTLQTISLILTNQKPSKEDKKWKKHYEGIEKTTLVVAPLALIRQWESEIVERVLHSHQLKVCVHHGPQRTKRFKDLALYDVVITTYQILVSEHGSSSAADDGVKAGCFGLHWWRVVLDEAHTIKNRNAKMTKASYALRSEFRWCLSGTPMQNNLDELQSLIRFLKIKPYDDLKEWKAHIDLPMKNGKGHIAIRRLHSLLQCFMKRRTKDILKEAGALNPGGKPSEEGQPSTTGFKVTERNVVTVSAELTAAERKFYSRLEARANGNIEAMEMGGKMNYASAFTLLLRMRQACNHPKLVAGKLSKDKDAMSTGTTQKIQEPDIDAMADMFAGMGIETAKNCSICGNQLDSESNRAGRDMCTECHGDLEYFESQEGQDRKVQKKRLKTKKSKKEKVSKSPAPARRPRNRRDVIDSDDEEEEGSWLVGDGERGSLRLGKAGGEEDENCEGGGDSIGPDDSALSVNDEGKSNLSSFVVDDETAKKEKGYISVNDAESDSDDDSLISISAITKKLASQTLEEKPLPEDSASEASQTEEAEDDDDSEPDGSSGVSESDASGIDDDDYDTKRFARATGVVTSAKIRELIRILSKEVDQHKFIVFSQFTSMLDLVEPFLHSEGMRFTRYDGSMKNDEREESLRKLRKDSRTRVLLCSLKCGSLGLNLTAATRVVILEPFWNPFVEEQAIDRVHRLTQTVDVTIYKLIVTDSIEEKIVDLQNKKRELAEQAIEGGMKKNAFKLGLNEIIDLFKPGHHSSEPVDLTQREHAPRPSSSGLLDRRRAPAVRAPSAAGRQESATFGRRW
ncbi:putative ATP-dependent helicase-like protein [Emericellopsis cladophorae]|uniref:ATP-dependent helicase-like protein n=1 Tax=Emericellopsis cladophorae TaxID=2686198 RepID=A0A9Q0BFH8_9HYPO|nr:putative ATP-dependent helicase-like protein [Emericellopsis cladophorae]KAI6783487.1 putative ATP-dependent helicase-like protein [Emericellopsis cladophorae]